MARWTFNEAHTAAEFTVRHMMITPVRGTFKNLQGTLEFDPDRPEDAWVETSIDAELVAQTSLTAAALASTVGLQTPGDPLGPLDPRDRYRELVAAWRALLASIGRCTPVVVVVEDLHWADPTMLDVLDELAERLDGPILFLCSSLARHVTGEILNVNGGSVLCG